MAILVLASSILITSDCWSQVRTSTAGILAEYVANLEADVNAYVGDKYYLYASSPLDGFKVGFFGKVTTHRGYWYSECSYLHAHSLIQFVNLKPQEDLDRYGAAELVGSGMYTHRMLNLNISRGFLITRWLSFDAGFTTSIQFKDAHLSGKPDSYFNSNSWLFFSPMREVVYRLSDGFNPILLSANAKATYLFGPLSVYVTYESTLTSVTNGLKYKGAQYPIHYALRIWSIGFGYTLFKKGT